jgi:hypothetical protein
MWIIKCSAFLCFDITKFLFFYIRKIKCAIGIAFSKKLYLRKASLDHFGVEHLRKFLFASISINKLFLNQQTITEYNKTIILHITFIEP